MESPVRPGSRRPTGSRGLLARVGRRLRRARETRGISRAELARRAGLSLRFLAQLEGGTGNISLLRLHGVRDALDLSWDELFGPANTAGEHGLKRQIDVLLGERSPRELAEVRDWLAERFAPGRGPLVALLGLRGAGKSSVGRELARQLGVRLFELDTLVEEAAGMRLEQIFELQGRGRYRQLERETLRRFLATTPAGVLATGGGIVTEPETYQLLRDRCVTVWLRARPEQHWERVVRQGDRRPMQGNPAAMQELRALWAAREPLYAQAEVTVDTQHKRPLQIARDLGRVLHKQLGATRARRPASRTRSRAGA